MTEMTTPPSPPNDRPRILVTGGPTIEDIDDVRFLSNRSTGRMGIALANAARRHNASTHLILGPTALPTPESIRTESVRSAEEMHAAVLRALPWCDILIMSAAVADYTPAVPVRGKIKKSDDDLILQLKRTPDCLASVARHPERPGKIIIGFALEATADRGYAAGKMHKKQLDAIVLNTADNFGTGTSEMILLNASGEETLLTREDKASAAEQIVAYALDAYESRHA